MSKLANSLSRIDSFHRISGLCRDLWKDLTGDDPMPRLRLVFLLATATGALGAVGFMFGLFGAFLKTISVIAGDPPNDSLTWSKVGEILSVSFWRAITGYGSAVVIHTVARLHKKNQPHDKEHEH